MNRKLENVIGFFMNIPLLGYYRWNEVGVHYHMCTEFNDKCKESSFAEFEKEFNSIDDFRLFTNEKEIFLIGSHLENTRLDNDIMRLNGVGHILTSYGLYRANKLIAKKIKELKNGQ